MTSEQIAALRNAEAEVERTSIECESRRQEWLIDGGPAQYTAMKTAVADMFAAQRKLRRVNASINQSSLRADWPTLAA